MVGEEPQTRSPTGTAAVLSFLSPQDVWGLLWLVSRWMWWLKVVIGVLLWLR